MTIKKTPTPILNEQLRQLGFWVRDHGSTQSKHGQQVAARMKIIRDEIARRQIL